MLSRSARRCVLTVIAVASLQVMASDQTPPSSPIRRSSNGYTVPGVGTFNTLMEADFTQLSAIPSALHVDTYEVGAGVNPYARQFESANVVLHRGDSLSMLVPGGQTSSPISSSQVCTSYTDILYGSVRTVAKVATAAGTCHGFFFYANDTQESDIEILTYENAKVHFTNQNVNGRGASTSVEMATPENCTSGYHEYRLDWIQGRTMFYIDGVLKHTMTENVPSVPGPWMWNNWANGGTWTKGPPTDTSDLRIRSITAYFNRTSIETGSAGSYSIAPVEASSTRKSSSSATKASSSASKTSTLLKSITTKIASSVRSSSKTSTSAKSSPMGKAVPTSRTTSTKKTVSTSKSVAKNVVSTKKTSTALRKSATARTIAHARSTSTTKAMTSSRVTAH